MIVKLGGNPTDANANMPISYPLSTKISQRKNFTKNLEPSKDGNSW